jgi:serine/threonine-protein kinase
MSPQNILVGTDGIARVLDFGVAKAAGRVHTTKDGDIKGKVLYMAPEQLAAQPLDCTADVYAAGVVLFEILTCVRMFAGENEGAALTKIIQNDIRVPSEIDPALAPFDAVVRRATAGNAAHRYPTALAMAVDLEARCGAPASPSEVSPWVHRLAGEILDQRARIVAEIERSSTRSKPPLPLPDGGFVKVASPEAPTLAAAIPATALPPEAPRRSLTAVALLSTLLLLCVGVIAILVMRGDPGAKTTASAEAKEPAPTVSAAVIVRPGPETSAAPPVVGVAAAPVVPIEAPITAASARRPSAPPPPPPPPAHGGGRVNCDPPYVVDKNGHQHFIPECMK